VILLTSTSDLLELVTGSTQTIHAHCSYVDVSGDTVTPGRLNNIISTATTTNIVASLAASTQRNVKFVSIQNTSSTTSESVTVQHTDGTNVVQLIAITLQPGYTLIYNDLSGWMQMDASGGILDVPLTGRWLATTLLTTTTSANFTTGGSTHTIRIRGVAGGGGGGGCASVAAAAGAAGGGGAGSYAEAVFAVAPNTAYAYQCGAAGTGSSGAAGNNGSNSTFTVGSTTVTCNGGTGGPLCTPVTSGNVLTVLGGAGGVVSTNGNVNGAGAPGDPGILILESTPVFVAGCGGSTIFGGGGGSITAAATGTAAIGYGAGGGGSCTGASTARAGGTGVQGIWIVDEFA
jgi:hypothetical protein